MQKYLKYIICVVQTEKQIYIHYVKNTNDKLQKSGTWSKHIFYKHVYG